MIRDRWHRDKRSAFTLIELLVVILIIAILVSLIMSAVMMAMNKIPEVKTRTEISEMEVALNAFMSDYGLTEPPPSTLFLNEFAPSSVGGTSATFLQRVFGKNLGPTDWNGDGTIAPPTVTWALQGHQCLVFYLGGIPNTAAMTGGAAASPQGFSTNNMKPSYGSMLGEVPGKRKGPYFTFETPRLVPSALATSVGFFSYLDPWQVKLGPMPYVYFSSSGINNGYNPSDCSGVVFTDAAGNHTALPYWTAQLPSLPIVPTQYTYSNKYQIISAGKDGKFGYNPAYLPQPDNLWVPASGAVGTGADDQANFSGSLLGAGQN